MSLAEYITSRLGFQTEEKEEEKEKEEETTDSNLPSKRDEALSKKKKRV